MEDKQRDLRTESIQELTDIQEFIKTRDSDKVAARKAFERKNLEDQVDSFWKMARKAVKKGETSLTLYVTKSGKKKWNLCWALSPYIHLKSLRKLTFVSRENLEEFVRLLASSRVTIYQFDPPREKNGDYTLVGPFNFATMWPPLPMKDFTIQFRFKFKDLDW